MKKILFFLLILQGILMSAQIKYIEIDDIKIPVVFEKQNSLPTFNLQLVFKNSGYIQDNNLSGLASLSAQLLNEGTKELGSVEFAEKLEEKAISLHTSHGFETFVIELSSLVDVKNDGISLLNKLLTSPNFSEKTLDKLKTIHIGSLKSKENDFDYIAKNQLKSIIFPKTTLQNPSSGTIKSISSITINDIKNFISSNIVLNNLIIVSGGDIEFKELKKIIKPLLKSIEVGKSSTFEQIKASDKSKEKILLKDTEQAYIYFASPFNVTIRDKDNYKAKVASFILGGSGFGSRLMEEIRVKRGLAYSAYGYISINKSHSYFTGYLQTKNETAKEAQELVNELVVDFVKKGVSKEELEAAKNFLTGSEPLRVETLSQRLNRSFTLFYRGLEQNYSALELEKIENLSLTDLNNYIKSHNEIMKLSFSVVRK